MSTPYNYQYAPSSWPTTGQEGAIQGPTDEKLTNSMASMAIAGGTNQPYGSFQPPPVGIVSPVYPPQQPHSYPPQPVAQTNSYSATPQAYGVPQVPYQSANSTSSQMNTLPQHHSYQSPHQSGDTQAPNSPYLVSTTSIQPSPGSYAASYTTPTSTLANAVPNANHPPSNYGAQYPSQYIIGSGAPLNQSYLQTSAEQPQNANGSAGNGKAISDRLKTAGNWTNTNLKAAGQWTGAVYTGVKEQFKEHVATPKPQSQGNPQQGRPAKQAQQSQVPQVQQGQVAQVQQSQAQQVQQGQAQQSQVQQGQFQQGQVQQSQVQQGQFQQGQFQQGQVQQGQVQQGQVQQGQVQQGQVQQPQVQQNQVQQVQQQPQHVPQLQQAQEQAVHQQYSPQAYPGSQMYPGSQQSQPNPGSQPNPISQTSPGYQAYPGSQPYQGTTSPEPAQSHLMPSSYSAPVGYPQQQNYSADQSKDQHGGTYGASPNNLYQHTPPQSVAPAPTSAPWSYQPSPIVSPVSPVMYTPSSTYTSLNQAQGQATPTQEVPPSPAPSYIQQNTVPPQAQHTAGYASNATYSGFTPGTAAPAQAQYTTQAQVQHAQVQYMGVNASSAAPLSTPYAYSDQQAAAAARPQSTYSNSSISPAPPDPPQSPYNTMQAQAQHTQFQHGQVQDAGGITSNAYQQQAAAARPQSSYSYSSVSPVPPTPAQPQYSTMQTLVQHAQVHEIGENKSPISAPPAINPYLDPQAMAAPPQSSYSYSSISPVPAPVLAQPNTLTAQIPYVGDNKSANAPSPTVNPYLDPHVPPAHPPPPYSYPGVASVPTPVPTAPPSTQPQQQPPPPQQPTPPPDSNAAAAAPEKEKSKSVAYAEKVGAGLGKATQKTTAFLKTPMGKRVAIGVGAVAVGVVAGPIAAGAVRIVGGAVASGIGDHFHHHADVAPSVDDGGAASSGGGLDGGSSGVDNQTCDASGPSGDLQSSVALAQHQQADDAAWSQAAIANSVSM